MRTVKNIAHTIALVTLVDKTAGAPDPTRPLVPMDQYTSPYRVLDCGDCFTAKGTMCHNKKYESMFEDTQSSNMGNAICCRPGYTEGLCNPNDAKHTCGMPSYDTDANSKYKQVLSEGSRNYQMYAFCPMFS